MLYCNIPAHTGGLDGDTGDMTPLRLHAKKLSLVALFALALQIGLSFGHIHLEAFRTAQAVSLSPTSAPDDSRDDDRQAPCDICATMAMAQTLVDAVPPALPIPVAFDHVDFKPGKTAVPHDGRWIVFQSRAPPSLS